MYRPALILLLLVTTAAPASAAENELAPDWTLESPSGTVRLSERIEDGPVVLFFWATWCPFCKALMPHLQSIELEYSDRVEVLALHFRDDNDPERFLRERGYPFTVLPDAGPVAELYGVHGTPGVIIVDQERVLRFNLYDL
ncbi:MAG: TlpA disulfide reductase family protein, partial [Pseudomonadota bacterium]